MEKLIIENRTGKPMEKILPYIETVVTMGKISGNDDQYCYHTSFDAGIEISSFRNVKSDRLVVWSPANNGLQKTPKDGEEN